MGAAEQVPAGVGWSSKHYISIEVAVMASSLQFGWQRACARVRVRVCVKSRSQSNLLVGNADAFAYSVSL